MRVLLRESASTDTPVARLLGVELQPDAGGQEGKTFQQPLDIGVGDLHVLQAQVALCNHLDAGCSVVRDDASLYVREVRCDQAQPAHARAGQDLVERQHGGAAPGAGSGLNRTHQPFIAFEAQPGGRGAAPANDLAARMRQQRGGLHQIHQTAIDQEMRLVGVAQHLQSGGLGCQRYPGEIDMGRDVLVAQGVQRVTACQVALVADQRAHSARKLWWPSA